MKSFRYLFYPIILLFIGCSQHVPKQTSEESVIGEWRGAASEYQDVRLVFTRDGRVMGYDGCNHFGTKYHLSEKNTLQLAAPVASTMMMCPYKKSDILSFFRQVDRFERYDSTMVLIDSRHGKKIEFKQHKASFPAGKYQITSYLSDKKMIKSTMPMTFDVSVDGKVSGMSGCNRYFANYTDNGEHLYMSYPAFTRMNCEPPVMDQESAFFDLFGRVNRYKVLEHSIRLYDANGETLIEITKQ